MFLVFKQGVYRHNCIGVFNDEVDAVLAAIRAAEAEPDDYHRFGIFEFNEDQEYESDPNPVQVVWRRGKQVLVAAYDYSIHGRLTD